MAYRPPESRRAVGDLIREIREERGLSRAWLARTLEARLGGEETVSLRRVWRWESGESPLPAEYLGPLGVVFELAPGELGQRVDRLTRELNA